MAEMNKQQILITITRDFGSLGHRIADELGKELGIPVVDKTLLYKMAENHGFDPEFLKKYDEKPRNPLTSRTLKGHSNSIEQVLADMVFKYQKDLADTGEDFIMVGRCADWNLRGYPNVIKIFITADEPDRRDHVAKALDISLADAESLIKKMDRRRIYYHKSNTDVSWGDPNFYNLSVNSSKLGVEGCVELIKNYIQLYMSKSQNWDD